MQIVKVKATKAFLGGQEEGYKKQHGDVFPLGDLDE